MAKRNEIYKSKRYNALSEMTASGNIYQRHAVRNEIEFHKRKDLCRVDGKIARYGGYRNDLMMGNLTKGKDGEYGGYKKDILTESLTERDEVLLTCEICKGIMREASIGSKGEQVCSCCDVRSGYTYTHTRHPPNVPLRKRISSLKCCCPLMNRGCKWLGTLNDCEDHLETCGYVYDQCSLGCGEVLQRNELKVHETEDCSKLVIQRREFQSCELLTHLGKCLEVEIYKRKDLCRVKREDGEYGGYKKEILKENLTEREKLFLICETCKGIMREASMSGSGEQFCFCCDKRIDLLSISTTNSSPNVALRKMISLLKCSCPLIYRGCDWLGTLNDCEDHLDTCDYVNDLCSIGCGKVLQWRRLKVHEKENCPQRIVECEHCREDFKSCELINHIYECPKMEVSCELKCGEKLYRENMAQHLEQECGLVVETCKLGCGVVLIRDELKVHEKGDCPQRKIPCKLCKRSVRFCDMTNHLGECPKMEMSCELECGRKLWRENMAQHLEQECGMVVETCKLGCGVELTRDELKIHVTDTCVQRKIPCEHCGVKFKYCDMTNHLGVCHRMGVSCELGCDLIVRRQDMTQHLEVDCVEKELECPFAKYKCEVGLIKRKYLSQHLEEKKAEHLELKLTETELKLSETKLKFSEKKFELTETELKLTAMKLKLTGRETIIKDLKLTVEEQSREIREQGQDIYNTKTLLYVCLFVWLLVYLYLLVLFVYNL